MYFQTEDAEVIDWAKELLSSANLSMIRNDANSAPSLVDDIANPFLALAPEGYGYTEVMDLPDSSSDDAALSEETSESNITVYNTTGWIAGDKNALCDAGTAIEDNKAYLVSIMTSAPDSETNQEYVADVVSVLWQAKDTLCTTEI